MTPRLRWLIRLVTRRLWFRATLISLLAIASALISVVAAPYLPSGLSAKIGADAVDTILQVIASSMLAVTTFSLSTMVAAYSGATEKVTPRATRLLIDDPTAQNVLSTFVGSFLYSLVALITLSAGAYGEAGRTILFVMTIGVVLLIVVTLLRWIDYLLRFGRVGETVGTVEDATAAAMRERHENPFLGGTELIDPAIVPAGAQPVFPQHIGYIQYIDMSTLAEAAGKAGANIYVRALPGTFVDLGRPLAMIGDAGEDVTAGVRSAFVIGKERSFDQDPRFGLSVLAEIASRALSPALNDAGTAIGVLGRGMRVLWIEAERHMPRETLHPDVFVPALEISDLFDDLFGPIARDGATVVEVQIRLQKTLQALARASDPRFAAEARRHARLALKRSLPALPLEEDRQRVEAAAIWSA